MCTDISLGPDVNSMFDAGPTSLKAGGFAIPDANIFRLTCPSTGPRASELPVTDWLTGHPNFQHILMTTIDDEHMAGMTQAMRKAGKNEGDGYLGVASGADGLGQTEIKNGHESASLAFFPEKYGTWLVPIVEDVLAGNPVPSFTGQSFVPITKDNIQQYYP
jgi:ribose transport system substrate-binding protein